MKKEIEINEWIESFLNGDLPPEELTVIERRRAEDPLFAAEIERHREIRGILTHGAYLKIKTDLSEIHLRSVRQKRIKRFKGGGFGSLLLGIIVLTVIFGKNDKKIAGNFQPDSLRATDQKVINLSDSGRKTRNDNNKALQQVYPVMPSGDSSEVDSLGISLIIPELPVETEEAILPEDPVQQPKDAFEKLIPANGESKVTDCSSIKIEGRFDESESCNNKPTGSIKIHLTTVEGGSAPYYFSLDKVNFMDTTLFSGLSPGIYSLYARDAANCISRIGTATITSVDCTYQAVFAPARGETWSVPSDPEKSGTIYIFSRTGTQVYTTGIRSFEITVWNGTADAGQLLPMGIYHFEIRYTDGTSFNGSVTIVR